MCSITSLGCRDLLACCCSHSFPDSPASGIRTLGRLDGGECVDLSVMDRIEGLEDSHLRRDCWNSSVGGWFNVD